MEKLTLLDTTDKYLGANSTEHDYSRNLRYTLSSYP